MATATQQIILEVEVDDSGAVKAVKNVGKEVDKLQEKTEKVGKGGGGLEFLEKISPKAAGAVKGLTCNIGGLAGGFKTLRAAIISTGIGALVVALTSLVMFFTKTQKGADMLSKATAGLAAGFAIITDKLSLLGEALFNTFKDPQQAIKDLWAAIKKNIVNRLEGLKNQMVAFGDIMKAVFSLDWDSLKKGAEDYARSLVQVSTGLDKDQQDSLAKSISGVANEMSEATKAAIKLKDAENKLRDSTRELNIDRAKANKEISQYRLIANDVT